MEEEIVDAPYTCLVDLASEVEIPEDGTLSRPLLTNDRVRVLLFAMSEGQELTEHTTPREAFVQIISGAAEFTLEGETRDIGIGAWIHMKPNLPHSVRATSPLIFLLTLVKADES
jgi:quercetin dioxygenase-like cupin family protein